jgi:hypothetical protein
MMTTQDNPTATTTPPKVDHQTTTTTTTTATATTAPQSLATRIAKSRLGWFCGGCGAGKRQAKPSNADTPTAVNSATTESTTPSSTTPLTK